MLSQTTEYALRAIVFLGSEPDAPKTTVQLARGIQAPVGYMAKVMSGLTRAGLVESQRGQNGGFTLARDPDRMTIYDVVQAVDPIVRIDGCPIKLDGHGNGLCLLHATLDQAMGLVEELFRATKIGDLIKTVEDPVHLHGGCAFPSLS